MNISKTSQRTFCGFAMSLEKAQRYAIAKKRDRTKEAALKDEFIRPMWVSPEKSNTAGNL